MGNVEPEVFIKWGAVPRVELKPGIFRRQVEGSRLFVALYEYGLEVVPEGTIKTHEHPHQQAGYLISGAMEVLVGDEVLPLLPGECYVVPPGVSHGARPVAGGGAVLINFYIAPNAEWTEFYRTH